MIRWFPWIFAALTLAPLGVVAKAPKGSRPARSLTELYQQVQDEARKEARASQAREKAFVANKHLQEEKLRNLKAQLQAEQARAQSLSASFDAQVEALEAKQAKLDAETGDLGELFGELRKIAGETSGLLKASLVSVQYPGHEKAAQELAQSKALASQAQIEALWQAMLWNMVKSGSVERFEASKIAKDGRIQDSQILRVGAFSAFSQGEYLRFLPSGGEVKLIELARQPLASAREQALALQEAPVGEPLPISIDPSRGSVVELLVQSPSWKERLAQGGVIGFIIIGLGILGLLIALERLGYLAFVGAKMKNQAQRPTRVLQSNPLGRLWSVAQDHAQLDGEALLLRLEEVLSKELPKFKRGLGVITLFATTAPLLGLLGTVTGMIATFQSITLFGNGDPKMMSGGISQALVTTELGLATSIPLMLVNAFVSQRANKLAQVLDDASTHAVAQRLDPTPEDGPEA